MYSTVKVNFLLKNDICDTQLKIMYMHIVYVCECIV